MMEKITSKQYNFICELLWGVSPIDKDWAMSTKKFQEDGIKILEKYPELDKSFFNK